MNRELLRYTRAVKKQLRCTGKTRKALSQRLRGMLGAYEDENPAPSAQELVSAFGPPEEMAATLCESLTEADLRGYSRQKLLIRIAAGAAVVALLLFSIYVIFQKEMVITSVEYITIDYTNENPPTPIK